MAGRGTGAHPLSLTHNPPAGKVARAARGARWGGSGTRARGSGRKSESQRPARGVALFDDEFFCRFLQGPPTAPRGKSGDQPAHHYNESDHDPIPTRRADLW